MYTHIYKRTSEGVQIVCWKVFSQLISVIGHLLDKISALFNFAFVWEICYTN